MDLICTETIFKQKSMILRLLVFLKWFQQSLTISRQGAFRKGDPKETSTKIDFFFQTIAYLTRVTEGWSSSQLTLWKRWGTPWTGHQTITGLTQGDSLLLMLTSTAAANLGSTNRLARTCTARTCKLHTERKLKTFKLRGIIFVCCKINEDFLK